MLNKLFKHDMRSVAGTIFSLSLLALGTTIVGTIAGKLSIEIDSIANSIALNILQVLLILISGISYVAVTAFGIIVMFIVLARFYKNFFTDQGYLTFTLPVKTSSLLLSKFFMTVVWSLYNTAAMLFFYGLLYIFGMAPKGKILNLEIFEELEALFYNLFRSIGNDASLGLFIAEVFICIIVAAVSSIFIIFLSITIGSIIAKKHKLLASFGFYYILNNVISAIATVSFFVFVIVTANTEANMFATGSIHILMIWVILFFSAVSVVEYLVCNHLLKKKLNLA